MKFKKGTLHIVHGGADEYLPPTTVLVLGQSQSLPKIENVTYVDEPKDGFDVVAVTAEVSRSEILIALGKGRQRLAPILDFTKNLSAHADYRVGKLNKGTLKEGLAAVRPIRERAAKVADFSDSSDAPGLAALGIAFTRDLPIEATRESDHPFVVSYPLLSGSTKMRDLLEALAEMGLLQRRQFDQAKTCDYCGSAHLEHGEQCPQCHSNLMRDASPAAKNNQSDGMAAVTCRDCGAITSEPLAVLACVDCGKTTPEEGAEIQNWYHYDLNEDGVAAACSGRLPILRFEDMLKPYEQACSARDFLLMVNNGLKTAIRYERPYSVLNIVLANAEELRAMHGPRAASDAFSSLLKIVVDELRTCDLVTAHDNQILAALPETKATRAGVIMLLLKNQIIQTIKMRLHMECAVAQGERGLLEILGLVVHGPGYLARLIRHTFHLACPLAEGGTQGFHFSLGTFESAVQLLQLPAQGIVGLLRRPHHLLGLDDRLVCMKAQVLSDLA